MTLDELYKVYEKAWHSYVNVNDVGGEAYVGAEMAALRAVVEALRDEVIFGNVRQNFNEILASDGVEAPAIRAAAGGEK